MAKIDSVIRGAGAVAMGLVLATRLAAQDTGFVAGIVVDDADGRPLVGATVSMPQTDLSTETGSDGRFSLQGARVGTITVKFEAPGYVSVTEELQLSAVEFFQARLVAVAAMLDEVAVIASRRSGVLRARQVDVDDDEPSSTSALDLLADQIPGILVARGSGNLGGGGIAVSIRGSGTFQSSSAPEVYLDGVRLDARDTGEHAMHVLQRIPASEVQRIRVLKGASASSRYPLSANGVIVIETRRGG